MSSLESTVDEALLASSSIIIFLREAEHSKDHEAIFQ